MLAFLVLLTTSSFRSTRSHVARPARPAPWPATTASTPRTPRANAVATESVVASSSVVTNFGRRGSPAISASRSAAVSTMPAPSAINRAQPGLPGHAPSGRSELLRRASRRQRARPHVRLDDDHLIGECRDQPVPAGKVLPPRWCAHAEHADERAARGHHVLEQLGVARRVGHVDTAAEHDGGASPRGQRTSMSRGIDADRATRHHADAAPGEVRCQHERTIHRPTGRRPSADDRHTRLVTEIAANVEQRARREGRAQG